MGHDSREEAYQSFCFLGEARLWGMSQESDVLKEGPIPSRNVWETKHGKYAKEVFIARIRF